MPLVCHEKPVIRQSTLGSIPALAPIPTLITPPNNHLLQDFI